MGVGLAILSPSVSGDCRGASLLLQHSTVPFIQPLGSLRNLQRSDSAALETQMATSGLSREQ